MFSKEAGNMKKRTYVFIFCAIATTMFQAGQAMEEFPLDSDGTTTPLTLTALSEKNFVSNLLKKEPVAKWLNAIRTDWLDTVLGNPQKDMLEAVEAKLKKSKLPDELIPPILSKLISKLFASPGSPSIVDDRKGGLLPSRQASIGWNMRL